MLNLNLKQRIVVFDFETNGLDANKCQPIEIAAKSIDPDGTITDFNTLVKCPEPLPAKIIEITGLTDEILSASGQDYIPAMTALAEFIGGWDQKETTYLIGHNWIRFDIHFLRIGLQKIFGMTAMPIIRGWDTAGQFKADKMGLSQNRNEERLAYQLRALNQPVKGLKYSLGVCCEEYNILIADAHRAGGDVEMTLQMFLHQTGKLSGIDYLSLYLANHGKSKTEPEGIASGVVDKDQNNSLGTIPAAGEDPVPMQPADNLQVAERSVEHDRQGPGGVGEGVVG